MAFIRWIIGFSIAIATAAFAVFNRNDVAVQWSPLHLPYDMPLYLIALGFMSAGFILGALVVWLNDGTLRREKRRQKRQIKNLEKELQSVNEQTAARPPATDFFPALPKATGRFS